jgi:hypothetical protein
MTESGEVAATPLSDVLSEARRITAACVAGGVPVGVAGGVGIGMCSPSALQPPLARAYADIDVVSRARSGRALRELLVRQGYLADETFNALHGARRLFFWDPLNSRQLDVFLDRVEMCHVLDLSERLVEGRTSLAPADLLLLKLQIFETNEKDYLDLCALLSDHEFGEDDEAISISYLEQLLGTDWGLWQTTTMVAERAARFAGSLPDFARAAHVVEQLERYVAIAAEAPKSRGWRVRARVGQRKRWYELPEESH